MSKSNLIYYQDPESSINISVKHAKLTYTHVFKMQCSGKCLFQLAAIFNQEKYVDMLLNLDGRDTKEK